MDDENHKNTWNNFTKFVLWGTVAVIGVLVLMALFLLQIFNMRIASILENQKIEKRISITPETAKKYLSLGMEVSLPKNYGSHLGINDNEYKEIGVLISNDENEDNPLARFLLFSLIISTFSPFSKTPSTFTIPAGRRLLP